MSVSTGPYTNESMHLHLTTTTMLLLLQSSLAFGFRASTLTSLRRQIPISSINALSSKSAAVEVSPSNHATLPLSDFRSNPKLDTRLVETLETYLNITDPTPIQSHAIPLLLNRHDVMASSATGSGKTIMFGLPLLQNALSAAGAGRNPTGMGQPSSLVIAPTRELAIQIAEVLKTFSSTSSNPKSRMKVCLATGGSATRHQLQSLPNCNILVGTPGRIVQYIDERKLSLQNINYLVIDEADRLLDLGFEKELTRISRALRNKEKQSVLCSATFPEGVQRLAADFLDPSYYFVSVGVVGSTHSKISQRFEWMELPPKGRKNWKNPRVNAVIRNVEQFWQSSGRKKDQSSVIVFSNTKDGVEEYGRALTEKFGNKMIRIIHGDKEQSQRNKAIDDFKSGRVSLLVATDVASRGIDITSIGLVVQADAPRNIDTYTHRIGRTGRAGASGNAITFIDGKSMGIASGLVNLLADAGQSESIPHWLRGMAHVSNARSMEEEIQIRTGSRAKKVTIVEDVINEEFTSQDFRRTAVEGSYGVGKDVAYRAFNEDAYSDSSLDEFDMKKDIATTDDDVDRYLEFSSSQSDIENQIAETQLFKPSKGLAKAIERVNGSIDIKNGPNKNILDSLRNNQFLRFEYIGLFPFNAVSTMLVNTLGESKNFTDMKKILMVAEKPSIAKAIADALCGNRPPRQRRGISRALPVYEFTTDRFAAANDSNSKKASQCLVRVTSVVGHVFSLGFDLDQKDKKINPRDYFSVQVAKKEEDTSSKLRVVDHLTALAGDSEHLVLWLDCDPEGENIAHEVIAITRRAILANADSSDGETRRIHRAKFSSITPTAIQDAFMDLKEPDADLSKSVDARQELDLRVGVALTRLLTWKCVNAARRRFSPSTRMISYGPCQTPALSFCVDRLREIEQFEAKRYWLLKFEVKLPNGEICPLVWNVNSQYSVEDTRSKSNKSINSATYNYQSAKRIIDDANRSHFIVKKVIETSESINPPVGLNTVALLEAGSKAMNMSPKNVMNVAEKLYSSGFISYPRTETTRYDPNGFNTKLMLRDHASNPDWGRTASYLLRTRKGDKPPKTGRDCGDHPPITPVKSASREEIGGGAAWRLYDFIARTFIATLHNNLEFTRTKLILSLPGSDEEFDMEVVSVDSLGFADSCRWVLRDIGATSGRQYNNNTLPKEGDYIKITKASIEEKMQRPPKFLQEYELIREMDSKGIGTDASMAVHVTNIVDRGYVKLCDETGTPLRPPLPPGKRKHNLPRQVGRYMIPTPLGASLLELFNHDATLACFESPALLSHPSIRKQMEQEVKQIALGQIDKDSCIEDNLTWFEQRYTELESSLTRDRVHKFGEDLLPFPQYVKYLRGLDAFEPIVPVSKGETSTNTKRKSKMLSKKLSGDRSSKKVKKHQSYRKRTASAK